MALPTIVLLKGYFCVFEVGAVNTYSVTTMQPYTVGVTQAYLLEKLQYCTSSLYRASLIHLCIKNMSNTWSKCAHLQPYVAQLSDLTGISYFLCLIQAYLTTIDMSTIKN